MATVTPTPCVVAFDDSDLPCDVVDGLAVGVFASGDRPWARTLRIDRVRTDARLLPDGAEVVREASDRYRRVMLAEVDDAVVWVTRWDDRSATVTVMAADAACGDRVMSASTDGAAEPVPADDIPRVEFGFWHGGARSPERRCRPITVPPWAEIRPNYADEVARAFDQLMALDSNAVSGRLLLLHGPPGTGKTTALRALAHGWQSWCQFDYVVDPERLLADPGYLMAAAMSRTDDGEDGAPRWRLLLLEDCDELIRAGAKTGSGQALSRLLNLTDGLLGQGLDLVIAITTNEPLVNLHPAVVRPGRCIAQIEVGPLSPTEARRWLGQPGVLVGGEATLAELYARRGELHTLAHRHEPAASGQYL